MSRGFSSLIVVGVLAMASCARVASTSAVDSGREMDAAMGGTGGVAPANRPDAPPPAPAPVDTGVIDAPAEPVCGAGKTLGSIGCSFYAAEPPVGSGACYVMIVVNPGSQPAKLTLQRAGTTYAMAKVARLPRGGGRTLTYQPFDPAVGLAPGDVATVFLSGPTRPSTWGCPFGTASAEAESTSEEASNVGAAFHLTSDRPVVAYDIIPYGGADTHVTSSSLLLPEEAWGRANLVPTPVHDVVESNYPTYVTVIAGQDETEVSIQAPSPIMAGPGVGATPARQVLRLKLSAGQYAQFTEQKPVGALHYLVGVGLSGTLVTANKRVAVVGGAPCWFVPGDIGACDSIHQQIPPFSAWGSQYAGVSYRSRLAAGEEPVLWMLVGAVEGTVLTYSPKQPTPYAAIPAGAPATLKAGQVVQFWTADPFVVRSQDADHPFYLGGFMSGGGFLDAMRSTANKGAGDPELVNVIATEQYLKDYTFLTDPTYSETNLVVVRRPGADGKFADVKLACAATPISGWKDLGALQFARVDLVTGDFRPVIPGCNNGVNRMSSAEPFSLTVWGWGTGDPPPENDPTAVIDGDLTCTSYGYPAGSGLGVINRVPDPIIIP